MNKLIKQATLATTICLAISCKAADKAAENIVLSTPPIQKTENSPNITIENSWLKIVVPASAAIALLLLAAFSAISILTSAIGRDAPDSTVNYVKQRTHNTLRPIRKLAGSLIDVISSINGTKRKL